MGAGYAAVCIIGFHFIMYSVNLLDLDWFEREDMDVFSFVDTFIDYITGREAEAPVSTS